MLKVLHLISGGDVGGAKTHVFSLAKELQKHITVKMICFTEGSFYKDALDEGIHIQMMKQKNRFDLSVVDSIARMIREEGFDIIHSHGARANFITRFLRKKAGVPCVTTIHSDFMLDFKGNLYKYLLFTNLNVFALKKFDYYIAVSEDFKKMLVDRHFPADRIFTVYNGLDFGEPVDPMPREAYLQGFGLQELHSKVIAGILGRLHPVKGHTVFLNAAANALKVNPDIHFLIGGEGDERDNLESLAKQLGIAQHVHFIGWSENPYDFINTIDINVLTSVSESFPYVLLEGARLQKPAISTAVGGIPLLIKDNENGYLIPVGDSDMLAARIVTLAEDKEKREAFGKRLFEHASTEFSLENLAKQHIGIYNSMLRK